MQLWEIVLELGDMTLPQRKITHAWAEKFLCDKREEEMVWEARGVLYELDNTPFRDFLYNVLQIIPEVDHHIQKEAFLRRTALLRELIEVAEERAREERYS